MHAYEKPSKPRNGRRWVVLIVARISTVNQDRESLNDQVALCKREAHKLFGDNVEYIVITSQVSGEYLDREELVQLEAHLESRKLDAVVVEDLGRICRRGRAVDFCELAEDNDTRLVSINDHIDTFDASWRNHAFFATMHHEISN
ncbi:MAG: recombinase family protein [Gemmatales bacterium]